MVGVEFLQSPSDNSIIHQTGGKMSCHVNIRRAYREMSSVKCAPSREANLKVEKAVGAALLKAESKPSLLLFLRRAKKERKSP
jgi:hypothetical protein